MSTVTDPYSKTAASAEGADVHHPAVREEYTMKGGTCGRGTRSAEQLPPVVKAKYRMERAAGRDVKIVHHALTVENRPPGSVCGIGGTRSVGGAQTNPGHINDQREIVGASRTATSGTATRAFLWDNKVMVDLNTLIPADSGWVLLQANCISASGQIVGNGLLNGQARGFLSTPQPRPLP